MSKFITYRVDWTDMSSGFRDINDAVIKVVNDTVNNIELKGENIMAQIKLELSSDFGVDLKDILIHGIKKSA